MLLNESSVATGEDGLVAMAPGPAAFLGVLGTAVGANDLEWGLVEESHATEVASVCTFKHLFLLRGGGTKKPVPNGGETGFFLLSKVWG